MSCYNACKPTNTWVMLSCIWTLMHVCSLWMVYFTSTVNTTWHFWKHWKSPHVAVSQLSPSAECLSAVSSQLWVASALSKLDTGSSQDATFSSAFVNKHVRKHYLYDTLCMLRGISVIGLLCTREKRIFTVAQFKEFKEPRQRLAEHSGETGEDFL